MNLPKFKDYEGQPVKYIQKKMDGHMYHIYIDKVGNIRCVTKNNKDKTDKMLKVDRIFRQLKTLPYATHLMVELHIPGEPATEVARGIAHADQRLEIAVFACPVLAGMDYHNEPLDKVMKQLRYDYDLDTVPVQVLQTSFLSKPLVECWLKLAVTKGFEGWVLKQSHMEGWHKLKPVKTVDAFVVSVTESDSETYAGHMKAVKLGLYTTIEPGHIGVHDLGECGGGFTKVFKKSMTYKQACEKLVGKVCEAAYQSITAHKKLQFPRFIRWRDDKDAAACTTEQLS